MKEKFVPKRRVKERNISENIRHGTWTPLTQQQLKLKINVILESLTLGHKHRWTHTRVCVDFVKVESE